MTCDDIIRMALEAGFSKDISGLYHSCGGSAADSDLTLPLERFAELVAVAERERCAQLCESYGMPDGTSETALALVAAIRGMK